MTSFWLLLIPTFTPGEDTPRYPETADVLRELYIDEITACRLYSAFAKKASEERYGNVETLFHALRHSESIHAQNFEKLLTALGDSIQKVPESDIEPGNTKSNLTYTLDKELFEIDMRYPKYIERIEKECYEEAIRDITYAWKAEMQHRDLIIKMQSAIGLFFGRIVQKLRNADNYFVCQRCGSTMFEVPKHSCIICNCSVSMYEEVE